jgi:hypothetical protein
MYCSLYYIPIFVLLAILGSILIAQLDAPNLELSNGILLLKNGLVLHFLWP